MSRDYAVCPRCQDLLPEWMDGTWTCECGETTITVDLRVHCSACGKSIKEHDANMTFYRSKHPSGGGMRSTVYFCEECDPYFYEITVIEEPDCLIPYGEELPWEMEQMAQLLKKLPKMERPCSSCGKINDEDDISTVGAVILAKKHYQEGDEELDDQWIMRPLCLSCCQKQYPDR